MGDYASLLRFRDQVKKETQTMRRAKAAQGGGGAAFALNPASLKPCAPSIGSAPPEAFMSAEQLAAKARNVETLRATLALKSRVPRDKYSQPQTASMDIGWHATRHTAMAKPLYLATHTKSDVAEYGEQYVIAFGCGPYDKTQPGVSR
jgi:hypothetical protein